MRWAQRRYFARSRRTTCAGSAATATGARPIRTGGWRSSCRRARWTGTAHGDCSVRTASGCRRFCCRAASSLLRGRDKKSPADGCSLQARSPRQLWPSLRSLRGMSTGTSPSPSPARAHGLPAGTAPRRLSDGERRELAPTRKCLSAHILAENFTTKLTRTVPPLLLIQCSRRDGDYDLMQIGKRVVF